MIAVGQSILPSKGTRCRPDRSSTQFEQLETGSGDINEMLVSQRPTGMQESRNTELHANFLKATYRSSGT